MEGSSQISVILSASVYAAVSVVMLVWAWFHLERRQEAARRTERIQQLVVVLHFVILAGWILRHRIGLSERDADPTSLGFFFELASAGSSLAIAASSILFNAGVSWNRFFLTYGVVAVVHGGLFGALALRWPEALGLVPQLKEVIEDRDRFGMLPNGSSESPPGDSPPATKPIQ
jgi:hypothetical protein